MPLWSINTIVALLSFVIAAAFGKALIPFLHKLKFGQPIKMKFGPEWHAKKQGTPTMGGILFILSTTVAVGVGYGLYRGFCTNAEVLVRSSAVGISSSTPCEASVSRTTCSASDLG